MIIPSQRATGVEAEKNDQVLLMSGRHEHELKENIVGNRMHSLLRVYGCSTSRGRS
jgi:hypothetical protein